jgi:hypothetical protein
MSGTGAPETCALKRPRWCSLYSGAMKTRPFERLALTAMFASLCGGAAAAPSFVDTYRVRVVAGHYTGTYESLALREVWSKAGPFWMAERRTRTTVGITGPTHRIERVWIDGRRCPALAEVVRSARNIPAPPTSSEIPPFHGARVNLAARRPDGTYDVRSDYEGPVARWWRAAGKALEACWGTPIATVDDNLLPLTLEQDSDEATYRALELAK